MGAGKMDPPDNFLGKIPYERNEIKKTLKEESGKTRRVKIISDQVKKRIEE
jgi:hypothetical protein